MRLKRVSADAVPRRGGQIVDDTTLAAAREIVDRVRREGEPALRDSGERFGDLEPGAALVVPKAQMDEALAAQPAEVRGLLERTAERIRRFARAQLATLRELEIEVPGGRAGQRVTAVERAGCYAPGGRFPLPSSVLMTVVPARVAGVAEVWVASPRPAPVTLAAAAVAGADALLAVGGAQAIAALAFGAGPVAACDVVVGPGNRWVTAAKKLVAGEVGIDMLAGPSELVVLADGGADPALVAADLLAQAEHDPDALPVLVTTDAGLAERVDRELERQLVDLATRATAAAALANGCTVVAPDLTAAIAVCERLAPEHLQVMTADPAAVAARLHRWGGLFVGPGAAEVLGDYGIGPNHTLPTGGAARFTGGLSVLDFVRVHTWLETAPGPELAAAARDAAAMARLEGLEAHARAAQRRAAGGRFIST